MNCVMTNGLTICACVDLIDVSITNKITSATYMI